MKLSKEYVVHHSEGESLLVPTGTATFVGIVRGNKTFGAIIDLLKEETDEEVIVAELTSRFDAPEETVREDVRKALSELKRIGAIDG